MYGINTAATVSTFEMEGNSVKKILCAALVTFVVLCLPGIKVDAQAEKTLAYVPKALLSPPWVSTLKGAKYEAESRGWQFKYLAPPNETASDIQMSLIEDFIQQKVDVLLTGPCDDEAIGAAVEKLNEARIPVVLINTEQPFPQKDVLSYVLSDEIAGGETIGKYCVEQLKGKGNVVIIEGVPGQYANKKRLEGFFNIVKKSPGIKVLAQQPANWERAQGMAVMENLITAQPNIDFVYVLNDEGAMGALQSLKAAGKLGKIIITGYDGNKDALESVKKGELTATVYLDWRETGRKAAEIAINYMEKNAKPTNNITRIPVYLVTKENAQKFLDKQAKEAAIN